MKRKKAIRPYFKRNNIFYPNRLAVRIFFVLLPCKLLAVVKETF